VALDEELIGVFSDNERETLLDEIRPQYIILKPSLHGGFLGCRHWITVAEKRNIGWWITSALESNIGLNAIAQYTYQTGNRLHQGLGTGKIYNNNIASPLYIEGEMLKYDPSREWEM
jgi:O-succinylbenzoate synthase